MYIASHRVVSLVTVALLAVGLPGCNDEVSSDEQARRAYLGIDKSVEKSLQLGFDGFNSGDRSGDKLHSCTEVPRDVCQNHLDGILHRRPFGRYRAECHRDS